MVEYADSPDLHSKATEASLLSLLLAPIQHYASVLTLLVLENYQPLLALQPFNTRRAVAHAVVSSVLKNETIIGAPEDVHGVFELCDVLLRDQKDAPVATTTSASPMYGRGRKPEFTSIEDEEFIEEQGWIAKMIHLLRSENEDTQFLVCSKHQWLNHIPVPKTMDSCYQLPGNNWAKVVTALDTRSRHWLFQLSS